MVAAERVTNAYRRHDHVPDTGDGAKPGGYVDRPVAATTVIAEGRSAAPIGAASERAAVEGVGVNHLSRRVFANRNFVAAVVVLVFLLMGCGRQPVVPNAVQGGSFDLQVLYPGTQLEARARQAFEDAAQRWSQVVVGDLRDSAVEARYVEQYCEGYSFSGMVDDILLIADVKELDGPGGIVGMAGACILRANGFPLVGLIVIDSQDIDQLASSGDLETVVLHEMGHVLDMSDSGWQRRGLLVYDRERCMESMTVQFTGSRAMNEYSRLGGYGRVPVENNAVPGTACSHWDYETFQSELMTGYLSSDAKLSRLTIAALADMGYEVDMSAADDYSLDPGGVRPQSLARPVGERLLQPRVVQGENGEVVPLPDHDGGIR